ncbi:hypothetical protein HIM_04959 [Hirsutella minnesotensis 3608]|uniref:DNA recombination and repair protein Rad51-like C-terminal domain-containing protein n=1 Tax=Hirsutella minnesotensis 3608 TaxID=1043627 RepID=A0A0F8A124_9HYPO|nr:hypothetical protein HIM_04959 [Hirsutella minnesotensis 3608]
MSRVPPLLEPILRLPPESGLVLVTSVLGASANWLVLRWAYALLQTSDHRQRQQQRLEQGDEGDAQQGRGRDVAVVLVSFMRDMAFWREGAARLGLDLDAHGRAGRFVFVDGLSGLFAPAAARPKPRPGTAEQVRAGCRAVLVIDQLDALLATASPADNVSNLTLQNMLLSLREGLEVVVSRDVSGVVRVSVRDGDDDDGDGDEFGAGLGRAGGEDVEFLYHVAGDGAVKVFERGT